MSTTRKLTILAIACLLFCCTAVSGNNRKDDYGKSRSQYVQKIKKGKVFEIAANGRASEICVSSDDWAGVIRAAGDLGDDIGKVTGTAAKVTVGDKPSKGSIIVGTIGKSRLIDDLISAQKIDVSEIEGHWEAFMLQTVDGNLVVVGSDKRGTIYGIYDISEKIGVSPWYWWADVPAQKSDALYFKRGRYIQDSPKVKYRGIFINDEEPSFGDWAKARFGGVNSKMYVNMFELLLRLKANYLWPAMWGKSFTEDDPMSPIMADMYGIIMGTSHHEPMMRANADYGSHRREIGAWDYTTNKQGLDKFFTEGIERNKSYETLITIGMRGDGDVALGKDDVESMKVLGNVVEGQREIIEKVHGRAASEVPQTWAIFTEVQRYYDAGFRVPDDVLLMFCDNNWGYIRRTGPEKERGKSGGMGMYYHIDMNGGPWNDRWINTTTIPKLREQFNLAYRTGIDDLWVINVGDLKPKELPIDFIMRYAWNPDAYPVGSEKTYLTDWATNVFGEEYAEDIADILSRYPKYNLWRKPEVQATTVFSLVNYHEADRVIEMWHEVVEKAENVKSRIVPELQDAYYQLVLYPTKASAGVAEMYIAAAKNNLYARQGRTSANDYAAQVKELFEIDKELSDYYNGTMSNGKWAGMMQDIHIGYTNWAMPRRSQYPKVEEVVALDRPMLGVAVAGCELSWPTQTATIAQLPIFDVLDNQTYGIDLFNRGTGSVGFTATADKPWIRLSSAKGSFEKDYRLEVSVDWNVLPDGEHEGKVSISSDGTTVPVVVKAVKADKPRSKGHYFGSLTGNEFSIPANKFNANIKGKHAAWVVLPDLGRDEACMGIDDVTAPSAEAGDGAPRLEYNIYLPESGEVTVCLGILPTQDISPARGLRIATSIDDGKIQVLDARKGLVDTFDEYTADNLSRSKVLSPLPEPNRDIKFIGTGQPRRSDVFDNLRWLNVTLNIDRAGIHTLKVYMIDPELVIERIVVNPDNNHTSYFGAPTIMHD